MRSRVGPGGGSGDCPGWDGDEGASVFAEADEDNGEKAGCPQPPLTLPASH